MFHQRGEGSTSTRETNLYRCWGLVVEFYGNGEGTVLGQGAELFGSVGNPRQRTPELLLDVDPVNTVLGSPGAVGVGGTVNPVDDVFLVRGPFPAFTLWVVRGVRLGLGVGEAGPAVQVKDPALDDGGGQGGRGVEDEGDAADGGGADLGGGGGDGVGDPGAEGGVAGLVDGEVVGACGEKGFGGVEAAVVEDGVDGGGEEGGEAGEEGGGLGGGEVGGGHEGEKKRKEKKRNWYSARMGGGGLPLGGGEIYI